MSEKNLEPIQELDFRVKKKKKKENKKENKKDKKKKINGHASNQNDRELKNIEEEK